MTTEPLYDDFKDESITGRYKKLGIEGVNKIWRDAKLRGTGLKSAETLIAAAEHSVGSQEAPDSARIELKNLLSDYDFYNGRLWEKIMHDKIFIEINGARQGMFLRSENTKNPVLLFLHGGAGSPEIAFTQKYPTGLEKLFTVCWWEQRGSGISYNNKITPQEMTMEQMISDTIAVTHYLRKRFGKEKIYIMGHSWGSLLGVLTVQQEPELFYAYIGIGQLAQQDRSERLAYTYMLDEFAKANNKKMIRRLKKFPIDNGGDISLKYLGIRNIGMNKLGIGVMHDMTSMLDCVKIVLGYKGYTWGEKFKFPQGSSFSLKCLWDSVLQMDLIEQVPHLQVPVYIFQGKYDYQVSYVVAKDFAAELKAPVKGFYTFENSAHSPCFEEPEKMYDILRVDVLKNQASLSDHI